MSHIRKARFHKRCLDEILATNNRLISENTKNNDDKKNEEQHVKNIDKNSVESDGESAVRIFESKSEEQLKLIDKRAKATKNHSRIRKSTKKKNVTFASELSTVNYSSRLKMQLIKVFRRKKKYKWDDGG